MFRAPPRYNTTTDEDDKGSCCGRGIGRWGGSPSFFPEDIENFIRPRSFQSFVHPRSFGIGIVHGGRRLERPVEKAPTVPTVVSATYPAAASTVCCPPVFSPDPPPPYSARRQEDKARGKREQQGWRQQPWPEGPSPLNKFKRNVSKV